MKEKTGAELSMQTRPSSHKQPPREGTRTMPHFSQEWPRSLWILGTLVSWVRLWNVVIKDDWGSTWGYNRQVPKTAQVPPGTHTSGRARAAVQGRLLVPNTGHWPAMELALVLAASVPTAQLPVDTFKWETHSD